MSGMDDVLDRLREFRAVFGDFSDGFGRSLHDLAASREELDPLWRDGGRTEHDRLWDVLAEGAAVFAQREAADYAEFIDEKIGALERFLERGR